MTTPPKDAFMSAFGVVLLGLAYVVAAALLVLVPRQR